MSPMIHEDPKNWTKQYVIEQLRAPSPRIGLVLAALGWSEGDYKIALAITEAEIQRAFPNRSPEDQLAKRSQFRGLSPSKDYMLRLSMEERMIQNYPHLFDPEHLRGEGRPNWAPQFFTRRDRDADPENSVAASHESVVQKFISHVWSIEKRKLKHKKPAVQKATQNEVAEEEGQRTEREKGDNDDEVQQEQAEPDKKQDERGDGDQVEGQTDEIRVSRRNRSLHDEGQQEDEGDMSRQIEEGKEPRQQDNQGDGDPVVDEEQIKPQDARATEEVEDSITTKAAFDRGQSRTHSEAFSNSYASDKPLQEEHLKRTKWTHSDNEDWRAITVSPDRPERPETFQTLLLVVYVNVQHGVLKLHSSSVPYYHAFPNGKFSIDAFISLVKIRAEDSLWGFRDGKRSSQPWELRTGLEIEGMIEHLRGALDTRVNKRSVLIFIAPDKETMMLVPKQYWEVPEIVDQEVVIQLPSDISGRDVSR